MPCGSPSRQKPRMGNHAIGSGAFFVTGVSLRTTKKTGFSGTYHHISISGDTDRIPCRLARKQATPRKQVQNVLRTGFSLEPAGTGDSYGFTLDGDGHFLLGDFTVTHNSAPRSSNSPNAWVGRPSFSHLIRLLPTTRGGNSRA